MTPKFKITRSIAAELAGHDMRFCPIVHIPELTVPDLRTHVGFVLVAADSRSNGLSNDKESDIKLLR